MILIADSGSTKTEWCLADQGRPVRTVVTAGINPFFQTREEIAGEIRDALLPALKGERIDAIYFYGAGCAFPEKNRIVEEAKGYIRSMTENFDITDMFVSFSGGKDSTVTAALLAKGFREVVQTAANAFRTFADKLEVDYSQKEQKHPRKSRQSIEC